MSIVPFYSSVQVHEATIKWNLFNWPYTHQLHYENSSAIMSLRTRAEAIKFANLEHERRADLIIKKLKDE